MSLAQVNCNYALTVGLGLLLLVRNAPAQTPTAAIDKTTAHVSAYLDELADVTCTERVSQEKLTPNGKLEVHLESTYDYLVMMNGTPDEFSLNESRLLKSAGQSSKNLPLLVTNGFSTLFLIFHPYYRDSFSLTEDGEVVEGDRRLVRVRFAHIKGKRTPIALAVRGREYPLEIRGSAWVEPTTGAIVRIEADLAEPMEDIGLRTLHIQVNYTSIKLAGSDQAFYYPASAYVEVETRKQHWRNIHLFTNYKRFGVSTEVAVSEKKQ